MSVPENAPSTSLSTASYNVVSRWLHWIIACLILFMIFLGWRLDHHDSLRLERVNLHKSVGILILLLSLVRIGFRLAYKAPPEPPMPAWQLLAAKTLHVAFYVAMIGMPLLGWLMVSTSPRPIPFFGLEWPHVPGVPMGKIPQAHQFHEAMETLHGLGAKLIIYVMVPLHVIAALVHQFKDKDTVVEHMLPGLKPKPVLNWRWLIPIGVIALAVGVAETVYQGVPEKGGESGPPPLAAEMNASASNMDASASSEPSASASSSSDVAVTTWTVDKAASKIGFSSSFQGEDIAGGFGAYTAQIAFDPTQLAKSHVKVTIDLASVTSGDNDRDGTLKSDSFFNIAAFPKAVFEAASFTKKDATHFVAHGKLTLHGVTKAQDLPFTLTIKDKVANMTATTSLDRTAFGIGSGDYASTDMVPAKVGISITLRAKAE